MMIISDLVIRLIICCTVYDAELDNIASITTAARIESCKQIAQEFTGFAMHKAD
jgi:hypothetical protein